LVAAALGITVLAVLLTPASAQEGEKKVSIDQVPKAVKEAILKEVGDGKRIDIGKITRGGKTYYEIEMWKDGKEIDVLFDSNGKVLRREVEGDAKEGDEDDEEEGKKKGEKEDDDDGEKEDEDEDEDEDGEKDDDDDDDDDEDGEKEDDDDDDDDDEDGEDEDDKDEDSGKSTKWQKSFDLDKRKLASKGRGKFFILEPGYQLVLEGKEGKRTVKMVITVLDQTRKIGSVETRVVEERETVDGKLVEVSRNFFAICEKTKDVFYFGEEVDDYKDGKLVAHSGAWLAGKKDAKPGLIMPGKPAVGAKFYQEIAPKVAMDRAEIVSLKKTLKTPAGVFKNCLVVKESSALERGKEYKIHAPGIGLIQDEDLLLTKYGFVKK
jgi:hypothetical protein